MERITRHDMAFAVGSQDYDSILFGAKKLVRNLAISGKRKVPNRNTYIDIEPEIIEHDRVLHETGLTHEQLVDVGILIGQISTLAAFLVLVRRLQSS